MTSFDDQSRPTTSCQAFWFRTTSRISFATISIGMTLGSECGAAFCYPALTQTLTINTTEDLLIKSMMK